MEEKVFIIECKDDSFIDGTKTFIKVRPNQVIVVKGNVEEDLREAVKDHNCLIIFNEDNIGILVLSKHILGVKVVDGEEL